MKQVKFRVLQFSELHVTNIVYIELRKSLYAAFSHLGRIEKISTVTSYRARGQAWIAFGDNLVASEALATMQNFLLYSKPMVLLLSSALFFRQCHTILSETGFCKFYESSE